MKQTSNHTHYLLILLFSSFLFLVKLLVKKMHKGTDIYVYINICVSGKSINGAVFSWYMLS